MGELSTNNSIAELADEDIEVTEIEIDFTPVFV